MIIEVFYIKKFIINKQNLNWLNCNVPIYAGMQVNNCFTFLVFFFFC